MGWAWWLLVRNDLLAKQDYVVIAGSLFYLKVSLRQTTQLMIRCMRQNWGLLQITTVQAYLMTLFIFTGLQTLLYGLSTLDS